jgi:hypothetical protein
MLNSAGVENIVRKPATNLPLGGLAYTIDKARPIATIDPLLPNPRKTAVTSATLRFNTPIAGLDLADLALTRDGAPVDLAGATLSGDASGLAWMLSGIERLTWATGRYTLRLAAAGAGVADLAGNRLAADASGSFHVSSARFFLPLLAGPPQGPGLVAAVQFTPDRHSFRADEPVLITVVVRNQGDTPAELFWVDLMLNPQPVPAGPTLWNTICTLKPCYGLTWYVDQALAPGQSVTLTSRPDSFNRQFSRWSQFLSPDTRSIYVVVDSWNGDVPYRAGEPRGQQRGRHYRYQRDRRGSAVGKCGAGWAAAGPALM